MENIKVHLLAIYVHIYRWILDMQIMYIYRQNICILDRKCISDMKKNPTCLIKTYWSTFK